MCLGKQGDVGPGLYSTNPPASQLLSTYLPTRQREKILDTESVAHKHILASLQVTHEGILKLTVKSSSSPCLWAHVHGILHCFTFIFHSTPTSAYIASYRANGFKYYIAITGLVRDLLALPKYVINIDISCNVNLECLNWSNLLLENITIPIVMLLNLRWNHP